MPEIFGPNRSDFIKNDERRGAHMKLRLTLLDIFSLVDAKILFKDQVQILLNNLMTGQSEKLPYVTKSQLKIFRKMGCVKI